MDGVHDMGGMHGFGAVDAGDDASFHDDWERLVFAMDRVLRSQGVYGVDEKRHAIERMAPDDYLDATYFERWLAALETLLTEEGVIGEGEVDERVREARAGDHEPGDGTDADLAAAFREAFESPASFDREGPDPRFGEGDTVVVSNRHPEGHTRSPRYARRAHGTVDRVHGSYVLPDANVEGEERAEPLYSVRFDAAELWGDDREGPGGVSLDLWESYLESDGSER